MTGDRLVITEQLSQVTTGPISDLWARSHAKGGAFPCTGFILSESNFTPSSGGMRNSRPIRLQNTGFGFFLWFT